MGKINKDKCLICKHSQSYIHNCDPVYDIFNCENCGRLVFLAQIYKFMYFNNGNIYTEGLKEKIEKYKEENSVDLETTVFVIGSKKEIDSFNNLSAVKTQLSKKFKNIVEIIHTLCD